MSVLFLGTWGHLPQKQPLVWPYELRVDIVGLPDGSSVISAAALKTPRITHFKAQLGVDYISIKQVRGREYTTWKRSEVKKSIVGERIAR